MEHMDGRVVLQGTASVGLKPDQMTTMVKSKITKRVTGAVEDMSACGSYRVDESVSVPGLGGS